MEREKEGGKFYIVKELFDFLNGLKINKYKQLVEINILQ
jgi:hypothetical protein